MRSEGERRKAAHTATLTGVVAVVAILALVLLTACQGAAPTPVTVPGAKPDAGVSVEAVAHPSLAQHTAKPKRLDTMIQIKHV
jgi:hypothetical protein